MLREETYFSIEHYFMKTLSHRVNNENLCTSELVGILLKNGALP